MRDMGAYIAARITQSTNGCWLWMRQKDKDGYGQWRWSSKGKWQKAHRESYQAFKGAIPDGLCVLHTCDTPACCNPDHLYAGTRKDNVRDMIDRGRANSTS